MPFCVRVDQCHYYQIQTPVLQVIPSSTTPLLPHPTHHAPLRPSPHSTPYHPSLLPYCLFHRHPLSLRRNFLPSSFRSPSHLGPLLPPFISNHRHPNNPRSSSPVNLHLSSTLSRHPRTPLRSILHPPSPLHSHCLPLSYLVCGPRRILPNQSHSYSQ